jgi:hypothetical protein
VQALAAFDAGVGVGQHIQHTGAGAHFLLVVTPVKRPTNSEQIATQKNVSLKVPLVGKW